MLKEHPLQPPDPRLAVFHLFDPVEFYSGDPLLLPCHLGHSPSAKNLKEAF